MNRMQLRVTSKIQSAGRWRRVARLPLRTVASGGLLVAAGVAIGVLPFVASLEILFICEIAAVYVLYATSVNVLIGYAHLISFGQAAVLGTGAYTVALLQGVVPFGAALLSAGATGGMVSCIIGFVGRRLSGFALAMMTLAVAQALYTFVFQSPYLGGDTGIAGVSPGGLGLVATWYLVGGCVALGMAFYWMVARSPFTLTLRSLQDDSQRVGSLGVNVRSARVRAFAVAGVGAGLAGGLYAYATSIATPDVFHWTQSGLPIFMLLIGGLRYFWGPAVGAVLLTFLQQMLSSAIDSYFLILGLVVALAVIFLPDGLLGRLRRYGKGRHVS